MHTLRTGYLFKDTGTRNRKIAVQIFEIRINTEESVLLSVVPKIFLGRIFLWLISMPFRNLAPM